MRRALLYIVFSILMANAHAFTVDSLYNIAIEDSKLDYKEVNRIIIALDAAQVADSLYRFDKHSSEDEMHQVVSMNMGYYYLSEYKYLRGVQMFVEAAKHAKKRHDNLALSDAYANLVFSFQKLGQHERALEYCKKCFEVDSVLADNSRLSSTLNNMAAVLCVTGHVKEGIKYILKAIEIEKSLPNSTKLPIRYGVASELYNKLGEHDVAMKYAEMAYEIERKNNNQIGVARRLSQMADIYTARGDHKNAIKLYMRSVDILEPLNEMHSLSINYNQLGKLYAKIGDQAKAEAWLLKAEATARATANNYLICSICEGLATLYENNNPHKAYAYLKESKELNDSLQSEKALQMSAEYNAMFNARELDNEIENLENELVKYKSFTYVLIVMLLIAGFVVYVVVHQRNALAKIRDAALAKQIEGSQSSDESQSITVDQTSTNSTQKARKVVSNGRINLDVCTDEERKFVLRIVDFVNANMTSGKVSVDDIASELCMSRSQLTRRINALNGGEGVVSMVNSIRLEKAMRLLKSTDFTIANIAAECGFEDASYFVRVFKNVLDMTPTQYRNLPVQ